MKSSLILIERLLRPDQDKISRETTGQTPLLGYISHGSLRDIQLNIVPCNPYVRERSGAIG